MIYVILTLLSIASGLMAFRALSNVTYPAPTQYVRFIKDLKTFKDSTQPKDVSHSNIHARFEQFLVELSEKASGPSHHGVGYFRLPDMTQVFTLSHPSAISQLYDKKNSGKFGQAKFFNRLAVILGPENLMSLPLGNERHHFLRNSILRRNEKIIPQVFHIVRKYFDDYYKTQETHPLRLSEVMDTLSRRVLLSAYFEESIIDTFENSYQAQLTQELMNSLYSLEPIDSEVQTHLLEIRNKIFEFGRNLFLSASEKNNLLQNGSWPNLLLKLRLQSNPKLNDELGLIDISFENSNLSAEEFERLIAYATEKKDSTPLASIVRDAINESLFIPLLGFDATATALISTLKLTISDPRIYANVLNEIQNTPDFNFGSNSEFSHDGSLEVSLLDHTRLGYSKAVIYEALRLTPPAPVIPEIVKEPIELHLNGKSIVLPAQALLFIPLETLHSHPTHCPEIALSPTGKKALNLEKIDASTPFPERWGPKDSQGRIYHLEYFETPPHIRSFEAHEHEGRFLSFKTGGRRCPGMRLAITEIVSMLKILKTYHFELTNEPPLSFAYHYESPLQRNGGQGYLKLVLK